MQENSHAPAPFKVYYDGACPLCSAEIATYQRAAGAQHLDWVDASSCSGIALGDDLQQADALARMHVRDENGQLISGAAAFAAIWERLPRTRLLGKLLGTRVALFFLEPAYRLFLTIRPLWRK